MWWPDVDGDKYVSYPAPVQGDLWSIGSQTPVAEPFGPLADPFFR